MAQIFIVDDEPILLELVSTVVTFDGHDASCFRTAADCIATFETQNRQPDLIITDIHLNQVSGSGDQVAHSFRQRHLQCPIVFMTGDPRAADELRKEWGPTSVLDKPFTAGALRTRIASALADLPQSV